VKRKGEKIFHVSVPHWPIDEVHIDPSELVVSVYAC